MIRKSSNRNHRQSNAMPVDILKKSDQIRKIHKEGQDKLFGVFIPGGFMLVVATVIFIA